jgi:hypothetical protein
MRDLQTTGFCSAEAGQGGSIATPSPHTPLPAQTKKT